MYCIDCSSTSIKIARLQTGWLGGMSLGSFARFDISGDISQFTLPVSYPVEKDTVAISLPDEKTFIHRLSIPLSHTVNGLYEAVVAHAAGIIPVPINELMFSINVLSKHDDGTHEVLFAATTYEWFLPYYRFLNALGLTAQIVLPQCMASFELLRDEVKTEETVLYLDIGATSANLCFVDSLGPVFSSTDPVATQELKNGVTSARTYFVETYKKDISGIVLSGGGAAGTDAASLVEDPVSVPSVHASEIIRRKVDSYKLKLKEKPDANVYANLFGLCFASLRKDGPNILSREGLEKLGNQGHELTKLPIAAAPLFTPAVPESSPPSSPALSTTPGSETVPELVVPPTMLPEMEPVTESVQIKTHIRIMPAVIAVVLILVIAACVYFIYRQFMAAGTVPTESTQVPSVQTPAATPTSAPTITPSVSKLKKSARIRILNGSGVTGAAAETEALFIENGYANVSSGDAERDDYTSTRIQTTSEYKNYFSIIKEELINQKSIEPDTTPLDSKGAFDIVIILGPKKEL